MADENEDMTKEALKASFKAADVGGDGFISKEELKTVFQSLSTWTDEQFDELYAAADKNADSKLNYNEFVEWVMADEALGWGAIDSVVINENQFVTISAGIDQVHLDAGGEAPAAEAPEQAAEPQEPVEEPEPVKEVYGFKMLKECKRLDLVEELSLSPFGGDMLDQDAVYKTEDGERYNGEMLKEAVPIMKDLTALKKLHLQDNGFGDAEAVILASGLEYLGALEELDLYWNKMTKEGCSAIISVLSPANVPKLKSVGMYANGEWQDNDSEAVNTCRAQFREIRAGAEEDEACLMISDLPE
mmetsp:Transcript_93533/g.171627  ORF Transcript_93533/g.171627 Transcript_93533/m.171627 type:complete len:302 (-) Transcript_93533:54-959(-)